MKLGKGKKTKEMFNLLKDESYRSIFDSCQASKTPSEIAKLMEISANECAEKLENLERAGAVIYTNGRWNTSEAGIDLRNKYWPTE